LRIHVSRYPGYIHFQAGHCLAEVIVDFAGDAAALFFANRLQACREFAQLFLVLELPVFPLLGCGIILDCLRLDDIHGILPFTARAIQIGTCISRCSKAT